MSTKSIRKNSERIDKELRETSKTVDWEGLKFPVNLSDINKFKKHNSSIFVNVFAYENAVYPLRISKHNYKRESYVNLILNLRRYKQHYCWIKTVIFANIKRLSC